MYCLKLYRNLDLEALIIPSSLNCKTMILPTLVVPPLLGVLLFDL